MVPNRFQLCKILDFHFILGIWYYYQLNLVAKYVNQSLADPSKQ